MKNIIIILILFAIFSPLFGERLVFPLPKIGIDIGTATKPSEVALTLQVLALMTILTLAPAIIMMVTSFLRVSIVLSFISRALATQQLPPNQVVMALSLFLTFFIMSPTINKINNEALQPYLSGKISFKEFGDKTIKPLREFMFRQTKEKDIALFLHIGNLPRPKNRDEIPTHVLIPAFMISELKTAFNIGILIFVPFIVIDLIVASALMSMGMIMLPPIMISMPLKIILFVLVDGWHLITYSLVKSFY